MEDITLLILSRKTNQTLIVGNVTVTVIRVSGGRVRLGITAPKEVPVQRGELLKRKGDAA